MRLRRPIPSSALFTATALASIALGAGCERPTTTAAKSAPPDAARPVAVKLVPVREVTIPRTLTLSGSLIGSEEAQVAAGAAGKVLATYVERGAVVKKGALLARLDNRSVTAQAAEAAAQVASLKAQQAQAQIDCQRNEQLFQNGAISRAEHDRQKTACETTRWSVAAAEARKTLTAQALQDSEIRAPFAGMVVERFVSPGEYVRPDSRVVTLVDVDNLRVELTVPEADVSLVRQGMTVEFQTSAGTGKPVRGRVRYVGPSVRKQTRDAVVEAAVDNTRHDLRPGMFVTAELAMGEQSVPAVPASAVRAEGTLRHVFLVQAGRLEDRLVQVADAREGLVPVMSGLKAGEQVVSELTPDVRDGAPTR